MLARFFLFDDGPENNNRGIDETGNFLFLHAYLSPLTWCMTMLLGISTGILRSRYEVQKHFKRINYHSKWFEPRSISSSYCVIVRVRVVLKRTVVDDCHQQQFFSELLSPGRSHNTNYRINYVIIATSVTKKPA